MSDTEAEASEPDEHVIAAVRKRRSRGGVLAYITKLFNGDVAKFRRDYSDENFNRLVSLKEIKEDKIKLSHN